jgi:hypothetical protein
MAAAIIMFTYFTTGESASEAMALRSTPSSSSLGRQLEVVALGELAHHVLHLLLVLVVGPLDGLAQRVLQGDHQPQVAAGDDADVVQLDDVVRVGDRERQDVADAAHGEDPVHLGEVLAQRLQDLLVGDVALEVDGRVLDVLGDDPEEIPLGHQPRLDYAGGERPAVGRLHRLLHFLLGEGLRVLQDLREPPVERDHRAPPFPA